MQLSLRTLESYKIPKPKKLLHIGANTGQEALHYVQLGIGAWHIEPIPELFDILSDHTKNLPNQHAKYALTINLDRSNEAAQSQLSHNPYYNAPQPPSTAKTWPVT